MDAIERTRTMTDAKHAAFLIDGVEYPVPTSFRLADPVLVKAITELDWDEFSERNTELVDARARGEDAQDPIVLLGLIAVAVWQRNPTWKRERVIRFAEQVDFDTLDAVGPTSDEPADAPLPPAVGAVHESPTDSASLNGDGTASEMTQSVLGAP